MKLKFRSSLSNLNKFNPFDSQPSDARPIDLSLKSRIKNFMKKTNHNEFKTSSDSINSIGSNSPSNSANSFDHHDYDQHFPKTTKISMLNNLINPQTISPIINVPPSPPNSVEEDEEDCFQLNRQQQLYYNQLIQKNYENQQLTNLLNTSHLNQTNSYLTKNLSATETLLSFYSSNEKEDLNDKFLGFNLSNRQINDELINSMPPSPIQYSNERNENTEHVHYQKRMVRKHISQLHKQRAQNLYNPYSQNSKRKYSKQIIEENDEEQEDADYYDSNKLINKLRMKYCTSKSKTEQSNLNNQTAKPTVQKLDTISRQSTFGDHQYINHSLSNKTEDRFDTNLANINLNSLQVFYKEYYDFLLSQNDATANLSALQIVMKKILDQKNNNYQPKNLNEINLNQNSRRLSAFEMLSSPSSSPSLSPKTQINQINFNLHNECNNELPTTPSSFKDGLTNDCPNDLNQPNEERKRSSRPLTGRHVRQGTGASRNVLDSLKLAIKERQKSSSFKPTKRKTNKKTF